MHGNTLGTGPESAKEEPALVWAWSTDTIFRTPESILYDSISGFLYVSNVNRDPWVNDGNGYISRVDLSGTIINEYWVRGLNGPKGMAILGTSLFVADIDRVVEIDLLSGRNLNYYEAPGPGSQLNDVCAGNGVVFVSGSGSGSVYAIRERKLEVFLEGRFERPNGLLWERGRLLVADSRRGTLSAVNLSDNSVTVLAEGLGQSDGIVADGKGGYIVSNWAGEVHYISKELERTLLLDTQKEGMNAADIGYFPESNLLLVPTFYCNNINAYTLLRD